MFIGRETELQFFNDKYNAPGGQLVVLYGRRRIGKTETLYKFCLTTSSPKRRLKNPR